MTDVTMAKRSSGADFLSWQFVLFYGGIILVLGIYAIGWQQIIKRMPISTAFSNKAITIIWGLLWGKLFFSEGITPGKIAGAVIVTIGVVIYSKADDKREESNG